MGADGVVPKVSLDEDLLKAAREAAAAPPAAINNPAADAAAASLIQACIGLDRGSAGSSAENARVMSAVDEFEAIASIAGCTPALDEAKLADALKGEWRLVYRKLPPSPKLGKIGATLADASTRRSELQIGECSQKISPAQGIAADKGVADDIARAAGGVALELESMISLRARVPWPLPEAPELRVTLSSSVDATSDGELACSLEDVSVLGPMTTKAWRLPISKLRGSLGDALNDARALPEPLATLRKSLETALLPELPTAKQRVSALSRSVRVMRSEGGALAIFTKVGAPAAAPVARADASGEPVVDDKALAEVEVRIRAEWEAKTAAVTAELGALTSATHRAKAEMDRRLDEAAAALAAAEADNVVAQRALRLSEESAAKAAAAAAVKLEEATTMAAAKAAASQSVAASDLAAARSAADEQLKAAAAEAAREQKKLKERAAKELERAEARAAKEVSSAQRELALALAAAEEEAAAARAALISFTQEEQALRKKLAEAEETAAAQAKSEANKAAAAQTKAR